MYFLWSMQRLDRKGAYKKMEKTTDEKNIITLYSIRELAEILEENEGSAISVQIEPEETDAPLEKRGDGSG